ncbi:hypothetical protein KUTeg_012504 [Tegillarca granosa]|uniref:guanylate cyclase n=1 Tax=Tegillarca granosa TaxID=220873 RepID=A0ABQ9EZP6_TEGGR|nr:hypothetical protein KUTeg_012504 [Tegillarca granosa]
MELKIDLVSVTLEEVAIEDGLREHAVFNIIAKKIVEKFDDAPPTFVAQTKKHGENQILKQDVEAVRKKLEQIKSELGENALPVAKYRSARAKWRAIAKVSLLSRGFVPNYPQEIAINPRMFIEVFPYHLIFDPEMKIYQSGLKIQQMMPTIRNRQAEVPKYFRLKYPTHTDFNFENIKKFVMCPFVLEPRKEKMEREWKDRPVLSLKGQMFMLRDKGFFFFIASPHARCWEDLESRKMKLADIPEWDVTRDFLLTEQAYRLGIGHSMFGLGGAKMSDSRPFGNRGGGGSGNEVNTYISTDVRDRLNRTQKDLDNERQKNESLYYTFLPRPIADVVRKGTIPGAVHFLPMVAACKPNEVVTVLNSLYSRFDKVTHVHETFRVESIGDAYMVIAGLPDKIGTHAERICNTALGMNYLATEVKSPLDGQSVQIRIGVHSGSVVWGVVGCRLPRLIVLGETAVVASKLESHGEPGKIHISPSTYR